MDGSLNHSEEQFQNNASGDTRGEAWRARPPLNFRPNRNFFFFCYRPPPPPTPAYLRVWMTALDPPLKAVSVSGVSGFRFVWTKGCLRVKNIYYRKSPIEYPRRLIYFKPIWGGGGVGGLIEMVGLFHLEKTMASVLTTAKKCRKKIKSVLHVQSCFLLIRPTDFAWLFLLPSPHDRILFE